MVTLESVTTKLGQQGDLFCIFGTFSQNGHAQVFANTNDALDQRAIIITDQYVINKRFIDLQFVDGQAPIRLSDE